MVCVCCNTTGRANEFRFCSAPLPTFHHWLWPLEPKADWITPFGRREKLCPSVAKCRSDLLSVGDNTREDIEAYISQQVSRERFVDPRYSEMLSRFTTTASDVDLSQPAETARGHYWFNLHIVLVTEERYRFTDSKTLQQIFDGVFRIARNKSHLISSLSVMPDHVHLALRPKIDEAPAQVARSYQNNLAYFLNRGRIWEDNFYVGTFGEYTMQAIRRSAGR